MVKKIVLISGLTTAGKTTTSYELAKVLPGWVFVDIWKIKEMFEPLGLKDRTQLIDISKKTVVMIAKEVMRKMHRDIILQEAKKSFFKKHLSNDIKKYNYKLYTFFLEVELKDAIKRDIQREKPTIGVREGWTDKKWKELRKRKPEKGDIIINTSKYNIKEVIEIILKNIGEKGKKHPKAHLIRRTW